MLVMDKLFRISFMTQQTARAGTPLRELPTVISEICKDEIPSYLLDAGPITHSGSEKLAAAFNDIYSERINWLKYETLRREVGLFYTVRVGDSEIRVLGIAHSSRASAQHVKDAIAGFSPDVIALESDVERSCARTQIQLPAIPKTTTGDCHWDLLGDIQELGGAGPSVNDLSRVGLLERSLASDAAIFLAASGSFTGAPELTAFTEAQKRGIPVESVDVLEKLKRMQNAGLEETSMGSRRIGDVPESVSRLVVDDQTVMRIYLELVYGKKTLSELGADRIVPTLFYRLAELNQRSSIAEDFLLREIHRIYRPKEFFTRLWLRDLYMAARLQALAEGSSRRILFICGAAHAAGVVELVERGNADLLTPSLCSLIVDQHLFLQVWRGVFNADIFDARLPQLVADKASVKFLILRRLLVSDSVAVWNGRGWGREPIPAELLDEAVSDEDWAARVTANPNLVEVFEKIWKCQIFTY